MKEYVGSGYMSRKNIAENMPILIFKDNNYYYAQCLDYSVLANGRSMNEAIESLVITLEYYFSESDEKTLHVPAPEELYRIFLEMTANTNMDKKEVFYIKKTPTNDGRTFYQCLKPIVKEPVLDFNKIKENYQMATF